MATRIKLRPTTPGPRGPIGVGMPTGGTAQQVLRKVSSTDYDFEYATVPDVATIAGYAADVDADAAAAAASAASAASFATNAATSAESAGTSATDATTSANNSANSATAAAGYATDAANSAGLAAAAVAGSDSLYEDTTAGIAGTVDGEFFYVIEEGDAFVSLYRNDSEVATFINSAPSAAVLDRLPSTAPSGYAWSVLDGNDRAAIGVSDDGTFVALNAEIETLSAGAIEAPELAIPTGVISTSVPGGFALSFSDGTDRTTGGILDDGTLRFKVADFDDVTTAALQADTLNGIDVADILAGGASAAPPAIPVLQADIVGLFSYGQSLAQGVSAIPVVSSSARFTGIRFTSGVRPGESPGSGFAPLTEQIQPSASNVGETPATGAVECVYERVQVENFLDSDDFEPVFFGAATGVSASTVAQLSKGGSGGFSTTIGSAAAAVTAANAIGKTYKQGAVFWTQGTSDYLAGTAQATYQSTLNTLVNDLDTDIRAATGQTDTVYTLCGQSPDHVYAGGGGSPTMALAQLALSKANSKFILATPMYHIPTGDFPHLTATGSKWLGAYYGLTYKRVVMDGEAWAPLDCIEAFRQGTVIHARFHVPVGHLTVDTTQMPSLANYGFTLDNGSGSAISISSVTITGPDTIRIVAGSSIPSGAKLRYGWPLWGGPPTYSGGNIRDQQGDDIVFNSAGINKRLDNFLVIFEKVMS